ncbi:hypothetical protein MXB_5713 [Myxobolus squamalis]|nr:hypothetical protein MXB_5713 [Myxobolus squamalis]
MGEKDFNVIEERDKETESARKDALDSLEKGMFDHALKMINQAISLYPSSARNLTIRAQIHIKLGSPDLALKDCDEALKINPDYAIAYKWMGRARHSLGDIEQAYYDYGKSCTIDYDHETDSWMKEIKDEVKKIQIERGHL